jgi:hypothetical protein
LLDLIRDADGQPMTVTREPLPEVLRGNPDRTEALIDASRHQWTYRASVISFAATDAPSEEQQADVMDHFERLAFAGLDPTQYDMLWVRHTHEDRVELHFCTPRLELTSGRSLNIAPPGYQNAFDSLRDVMNQRHGWADPMELERVQEVRDTIETPTRAQGRDELHAWILDQVSVGLISDRASMIDALADAGFDARDNGDGRVQIDIIGGAANHSYTAQVAVGSDCHRVLEQDRIWHDDQLAIRLGDVAFTNGNARYFTLKPFW